jgi:GNAT superfamily N-acetyltransferase
MNAPAPNASAPCAAPADESRLEIGPLWPALPADSRACVEGGAFVGQLTWAPCLCPFTGVDHDPLSWSARSAQEDRAAAGQCVCSHRTQGLLACGRGQPVGGCRAAPRTRMAAFDDAPDPHAARTGQVTCFVVARPYRRSGAATALVHAACGGLKAQGWTIAAATPLARTRADARAHDRPLALDPAAGFSVHRRAGKTVCVRRDCA